MKELLSKLTAVLCAVTLMPTVAFGQTPPDEVEEKEPGVEIEKIDDSGMTDEELAELEAKFDEFVMETKNEKEKGFISPEMSIPKRILSEEENEIITYATSDYEEYEPNDTMKLADRVYLDEYMYGTIEEEGDVDYYKIKFTDWGQGYFRLTVPDELDYELYLIAPNGTQFKKSVEGTGETERIYAFVSPDIYYYIRVEGAGDSDYDDTEQYRLRVKFYDDIEETAFCVGADYRSYDPPDDYDIYDKYPDNGEIDTTDTAKDIRTILKSTDYYNTTLILEPTFRELDDVNNDEDETDRLGSSIVFLDGHGTPDHIKFYFNDNEDEYHVSGVSTKESEGVHSKLDFDFVRLRDKEINSRLMVFAACYTAGEPDSGRNLPDDATRRGAECAIGWEDEVKVSPLRGWSRDFFEHLVDGHTVLESALYADEDYTSADPVTSWAIYGNEDCIIYPEGGTPISRSSNSDINIAGCALEENGYSGIEVSNNDLSELDDYITDNYDYADVDDYEITVKERDTETLQIYYEKFINGFNTNSGFYAVSRNGKVVYFSEKEFTSGDEDELLAKSVHVDLEVEQIAKEAALEEISSNVHVEKQTVNKEIRDGKYCLVIDTVYAIDYNTSGEAYGCAEYIYEL